MKLTGGNYGDYTLENGLIYLDTFSIQVVFNSNNEFCITDNEGNIWNYRMEPDLNIAIFTGVTK